MKRRTFFKRLGQGLLIFAAMLAVVIVFFLIISKPAPAHPWFAARPGDHRPLVFAHQGGENLWPSNTMLAFQNSVELGADVIDTDMHLTKDGVLVLMHDQTVDRTTDGTGAIRDLTLAEIKSLDAGYDFSLDNGQTFPFRGQALTVPTLEELFQALPDKRFGIEIKQTEPVETAQRFCAMIRQYHLESSVLVSSFRQSNMDEFRRQCPEVATSATQEEVTVFFALNTIGLSAAYTPNYHSLQVPETFSIFTVLTPQFVAGAHGRGLAVQPWTINDEADLKRIL
ncbi:partial glycerophosphoryl diester phosphodiesterase, partial [Anaerolineae bacterium]